MSHPLPTADDMRIETPRLRLRAMTPADADDVATLAGDARVAEMTALVPHPYPADEASAWIATHDADRAAGEGYFFLFTEKNTDKVAGSVSLDEMEDLALGGRQYDLGYWTAAARWGNGLATEAARAARDWAFETLGAGRLTAYCLQTNAASARVLEKVGFLYLNTVKRDRPARGYHALCACFRLDKPRWEAMKRTGR